MKQSYLEKILTANVYDVAIESPLDSAKRLSRRYENRVWLKREDLQPVFSFKLRGAYNKLYKLSQQGKVDRVIASSAGNHAQGLALAAQKLGIKAIIVMPETTPRIKVDAVRSYGASIKLQGETYDEAYEYAQQIAIKEKIPFIHPYDDEDVIAGQGTVGMEILRQHPNEIHAVFVPVGGGGLIAGVAAYIKALRPKTKIIGVEPEDAASMYQALKASKRVRLDQVGIFADGVAVRQVGNEPFKIAKQCVDEVMLVSTDEICAAIKDIFDDTRSIAEPAGALSVAALKNYIERENSQDQSLVAIVSGANVNFDRLRHVSERSEIGEHREMLIGVTVLEQPGSFRKLCGHIGKRNITEFNYRYNDDKTAHVFTGLELSGGLKEKKEILDKLAAKGYEVVDMTDNEMAKLHVRYMVGGSARSQKNERLMRFEFPERPGALLRFLNSLSSHWNISLFHYRNHGGDYGRVLVGIQLPENEQKKLGQSLDALGYSYWDETNNPAYKMFLT
jgi:threonine dehydratase